MAAEDWIGGEGPTDDECPNCGDELWPEFHTGYDYCPECGWTEEPEFYDPRNDDILWGDD